jgi:formate dehydrogenase major subunit
MHRRGDVKSGLGRSFTAADTLKNVLLKTRQPGATEWEEVELEWAMDRVAQLVKKTRDETFVEKLSNGKLVNYTPAIFALGGATLDNEWNHMQQKLMRGLGVVAIENQARI